MTALRKLSPRPTLVVDQQGRSVNDPQRAFVGKPGFVPAPGAPGGGFGRYRVVSALPPGERVAQHLLTKAKVIRDQAGGYLADPQGNLIGMPALSVARMLSAWRTEDARRL